ncbi:MAG: DUF6502 family protein [Wenzhouxiangellaceae bacterium]
MDATSEKRMTTLDALARAAMRIFRPLARILLRHNVSYKTCAEWLRWCYADVAWTEFPPPGRKQSKSRVAVLTGLTRIDVHQLLAMPAPNEVEQHEQHHRAALVLSGWANDPAFRDADGKPLSALPFEAAPGEPSFSELVNHHSGGTPARAVLDELERNGAVRVRPDRTIDLVRSRYITQANDTDINYSQIFGMSCGELIETISHNWQPDQPDKRLQLLVYNRDIHPKLVVEARERIENAARNLAEHVDALLYEYETRSGELDREAQSDPARQCVGLGLYYFQSPLNPEPKHLEGDPA